MKDDILIFMLIILQIGFCSLFTLLPLERDSIMVLGGDDVNS